MVRFFVAVACAGFAGSASAALTPAQITTLDTANAGNRVFFLSGASAVQGGLTAIETSLFNAGSFRLANTTASSKDFEAIAGTFADGTRAVAPPDLLATFVAAYGVNPRKYLRDGDVIRSLLRA